MILLDTNVLVALADPRDELNPRAVADVQKLKRIGLLLPTPVLAESLFIIQHWEARTRLRSLIHTLEIQPFQLPEAVSVWEEIFSWLFRYEEHNPDWVDAYLVVASGREKRLRVWTYDQEFWKLWRRPDGTPVPLAVKAH